MARTTDALVQAVLQDDFGTRLDGSTPSLTRYVQAATLIVDRVDTCATNRGYTLTSDELAEIETWLAAHYYTRSDKTYASRSTGRASGAFHGQTGMHLEASFYGQTAMELDPSGCLKAITMGQRAGASWLGRAPSAQTDYADRN